MTITEQETTPLSRRLPPPDLFPLDPTSNSFGNLPEYKQPVVGLEAPSNLDDPAEHKDIIDKIIGRNPDLYNNPAAFFNPLNRELVGNRDRLKTLVGLGVVGAVALSGVIDANESSSAEQQENIPTNEVIMDRDIDYLPEDPKDMTIEIETSKEHNLSDEQKRRVEAQLESYDPKALEYIEILMPTYEAVEQETGVNRFLLAALHYREGGNSLERSAVSGELLGTPNYDDKKIHGTNNFDNIVILADKIKENARLYSLDPTNIENEEQLKYIMLAHNRGHRYKDYDLPPELSTFVMNFLNNEESMDYINHPAEPKGTRGLGSNQVGALPMLLYLEDLHSAQDSVYKTLEKVFT